MTFIPFPEYRPDVDDWRGQHTQVLNGVLPRGDGYGPVKDILAYTQALPAACRGMISARNTDGTIVVIAATSNRLFKLNNTDLSWTPVSKVTALTSITGNPGDAVLTLASHGLSNGDTLVLTTSGTLPTGLSTSTVYYVVSASTDTFKVATTSGGTPITISDAGSGTHSMTYFYSTIPSTDQWQFAQFGTNVVAVQSNISPQVLDISAATNLFADLSGSPPSASYVTVVGRFLALTGLTSNPLRIFWSDLDDITVWTAGSGFSNYVDLPDGGIVRGVAGGEFGIVFQESVIRRMVYVPGAKPAFQFERITEDMGLLGPYSIARASEKVFFISQHGFHEYTPGTGITNVGKERVDRTFLADLDQSNLQLLIGSSDPSNTRAFWCYKSIGTSDTTMFDKMICYDYELNRFSPAYPIGGQFISALVKPGLTLENMDSINSNIDSLTASFDTIQAALTSELAASDSTNKVGFFQGSNIEATLETPEQSLDTNRVRVRGFEVRTDATNVYGKVRYRANATASLSSTSETLINSQGICPQNIDTRYARARVRIPAGDTWTYIMGVTPDFKQAGKR